MSMDKCLGCLESLFLLVFCSLAHLHIPLSIGIWSFPYSAELFQEGMDAMASPALSDLSFFLYCFCLCFFNGTSAIHGFGENSLLFKQLKFGDFNFSIPSLCFFQLCFLSLRRKKIVCKNLPSWSCSLPSAEYFGGIF